MSETLKSNSPSDLEYTASTSNDMEGRALARRKLLQQEKRGMRDRHNQTVRPKHASTEQPAQNQSAQPRRAAIEMNSETSVDDAAQDMAVLRRVAERIGELDEGSPDREALIKRLKDMKKELDDRIAATTPTTEAVVTIDPINIPDDDVQAVLPRRGVWEDTYEEPVFMRPRHAMNGEGTNLIDEAVTPVPPKVTAAVDLQPGRGNARGGERQSRIRRYLGKLAALVALTAAGLGLYNNAQANDEPQRPVATHSVSWGEWNKMTAQKTTSVEQEAAVETAFNYDHVIDFHGMENKENEWAYAPAITGTTKEEINEQLFHYIQHSPSITAALKATWPNEELSGAEADALTKQLQTDAKAWKSVGQELMSALGRPEVKYDFRTLDGELLVSSYMGSDGELKTATKRYDGTAIRITTVDAETGETMMLGEWRADCGFQRLDEPSPEKEPKLPGEPITPEAPEEPEVSEEPDALEEPKEPKTPEEPVIPGEPANPEVEEPEVTPEEPDVTVPEEPEVTPPAPGPEEPSVEIPEEPETTDTKKSDDSDDYRKPGDDSTQDSGVGKKPLAERDGEAQSEANDVAQEETVIANTPGSGTLTEHVESVHKAPGSETAIQAPSDQGSRESGDTSSEVSREQVDTSANDSQDIEDTTENGNSATNNGVVTGP